MYVCVSFIGFGILSFLDWGKRRLNNVGGYQYLEVERGVTLGIYFSVVFLQRGGFILEVSF